MSGYRLQGQSLRLAATQIPDVARSRPSDLLQVTKPTKRQQQGLASSPPCMLTGSPKASHLVWLPLPHSHAAGPGDEAEAERSADKDKQSSAALRQGATPDTIVL